MPPWSELATKGFVHVPGFLSPAELGEIAADLKTASVDGSNANYKLIKPHPALLASLSARLLGLAAEIRTESGVNVDLIAGGEYFSTGLGIDLGWHQDHESYFTSQDHRDYLNFYLPIVKPRIDKTNLCLVPLDALKRRAPRVFRHVFDEGGGTFLKRRGGRTLVRDDNRDGRFYLPFDIEELKVTPQLAPGDLLLLRGDALHRTEDTETDRTALSIRAVRSTTIVDRRVLARGGLIKAAVMWRNRALYNRMFRVFDEQGSDVLPLGVLLGRIARREPGDGSRLRFLASMLRHRL